MHKQKKRSLHKKEPAPLTKTSSFKTLISSNATKGKDELLKLMSDKYQSVKPSLELKNPFSKELLDKISFLSSDRKEEKEKKWSQDFTDVDCVIGNTIFMNDGRAIGVMEILPINFYRRSAHEQNIITGYFQELFRIAPVKLHFKVRTEEASISKTIYTIRKANAKEKDPKVLAMVDEYINHIKNMQARNTLSKRFYLFYEYEGEYDGHKSRDKKEIATTMAIAKNDLANVFIQAGNLVVEPENPAQHVIDILYRFYNPNTSTEEPMEARFSRVNYDKERYNNSVSKKDRKDIFDTDYFAPKGLNTRHHDFIVTDGQYQTFLVLRDNGFPTSAYAGWVDSLANGQGIDIDIFSSRISRDVVLGSLKQLNRINRVRAQNKVTNVEKYNEIMSTVENIDYITSRMQHNDEDAFDVMIVITIRSNSFKDMIYTRNSIVKAMKSKSLYMDDSFVNATKLFRMVTPGINIDNALFRKYAHNFLTSSMASLYCFTAYELFDETGFVMGVNASNSTLVSINNFNTKRYANANILIIGTSGAGKTFTEQMLAYRMRMTGVRTLFILPTKGRVDYYGGCQNMGGTFITLDPSGNNSVNIMEIRPEVKPDEAEYDSTDSDLGDISNQSLLSSKITSVTVFLQLLMGKDEMTLEEEMKLNVCLKAVYNRFGITNDNNSIWKDKKKGIIKEMPILEDLYNEIKDVKLLNRILVVLETVVHGDYSSLNKQTNVDLTNKYIVFDIDDTRIGERMLPAFLYVAFDCCYSMAKENLTNRDAIFMDEVWRMMTNEACAKQVKQMVKLIRAYGSCVCMATQDIEDFLGTNSEFGASVINNTELKIFMKLTDREVETVDALLHFSDEEKKYLRQLHHQGMIFANSDKVICNMIATDKEIRAFTTDVNLRRKFAEEAKKKRKPTKSQKRAG